MPTGGGRILTITGKDFGPNLPSLILRVIVGGQL
jgi:hypothetical protein